MLRKEPIEKSGSTQKTLRHLQQSDPNLDQKNWFYPRQATNKKWKVQNGALRKNLLWAEAGKGARSRQKGFYVQFIFVHQMFKPLGRLGDWLFVLLVDTMWTQT